MAASAPNLSPPGVQAVRRPRPSRSARSGKPAVQNTPAGEVVTITFRPRERAPTDAPWTLSRARAVGTIVVRSASGDHVVAVAPDSGARTHASAGTLVAPGTPLLLRGGSLVELREARPFPCARRDRNDLVLVCFRGFANTDLHTPAQHTNPV